MTEGPAHDVKFGRKPKLSDYQRAEALKRRAAGETLASIAKGRMHSVRLVNGRLHSTAPSPYMAAE
jgi:hypothetical protein